MGWQDATVISKWDSAPVVSGKPPRGPVQEPKDDGFIAGTGRAFKNVGATAGRALNVGMASFSEALDDIATVVSEKTGMPKGGAFEAAKQFYLENAEYWDRKIQNAALPEEIVGEFLGGAAPGMADFMLGVPFAAAKGYAKEGAIGAVKEGAHRALMGQILHVANELTTPIRTAVMATVGGVDAATQGGDAREIAKSAGVMAGFGLVGGKGRVGAKEIAAALKWQKAPVIDRATVEKTTELRVDVKPEKLAEAVGKPEQIKHLTEIGVKEPEAQAREIVRDAVEQPENLATMAEAKGKTELAARLHQKAAENGEKLIAADGPITEQAVRGVLQKRSWEKAPEVRMTESPNEQYVPGASAGKYSESPSIIEMPEVVGMARDLLGGQYPGLVNRFRKDGVRGMFRQDGKIQLRRDLAQDINQASKTLAHEIGHAVDWLPDKDLARGNILGRVASLKKYAKNTLAPKPVNLEGTTQGPLTEAERAQLRREARALAKKDAEVLIDEVIKKEIPVTPEEVLAIFKGLELDKEPNKDLVHFIFTASTPVKKSMVVQAMKGLTLKEVSHLTNIIDVKTGNKIKQGNATEEAIYKKYKELVKNEIARRMLFEKETITNELKAHTLEWRPFTPMANRKYTAYRHSSPELYADAISALITSPKTLERNAPTFYKAFFNYIERKPEVKRVWEEIQDTIRTGTVSEKRIAGDYEMFQRGHEAREEARATRENTPEKAFDTLARGLWDKNHAVLREIRKLEKKGDKHAKETRYEIEEIQYISSEADAYMNDLTRKVAGPMDKAGITADDLGVYLMRRHIETNREGIFSTKGYTPETVRRDLDALRQRWGAEKFAAVEQAAQNYRALREDYIIPLLEKSGLATPELIEVIKDRDNYSRVSVIKYLEEAHGRGTTSKIYKQVGTLEEIENPYVATVLQDLSMLRAARINIAKKSLVEDLLKTGAIEPAEMKYSQDRQGMVPVEPKDRSVGVYTVMVNGKPQHYYTAKPITEAFEFSPFEATQIAAIWKYLSQPIREILVSKNPIWMTRNVFRDFRETVKKVPEVRLRDTLRLAAEYKRAWPEVWAEVRKQHRAESIQSAMRTRAITPDRVWQPKEMNFENEIQRIADSFNLSVQANKEAPQARARLLTVYRALDEMGRASELLGKMAGWNYLKKYSTRSEKERAHVVRSRIGTPDFKRQGEWQQVTNNLFMFSNVGKEGIRAHVETYRENPQAYIWKTVATNFLPKAVLAAGASGAFGSYYQKVIAGIPEYDKSNYTIIPLYLDDNGKSVYLRIPEDYEGQFFGALAWKLAHLEIVGKGGAISTVVEQNPYKLMPLLSVGKDLGDYYLRGQNPVDDFRGQQVLTDREMEAGGGVAAKKLGEHAWKNLGGSVFYDPSSDDIERQKTALEQITKTFPGNILGTFLKTSDRGISEQIDRSLGEYRKEKARTGIAADAALIRLANGEEITADEVADIMVTGGPSKAKIEGIILRQHGTAVASALARARSKEEVFIILNEMEKQNGR